MMALVTGLFANPYDQPDEPYFKQYDKQLHIGATIAISAITYAVVDKYFELTPMQTWLVSFGTAFVAVSAKEVLYDTNGDIGDVGANAIGSAVGATGMLVIYEW